METDVVFSTSFFEANTCPNVWGLFVNAGYLTIKEVVDVSENIYCLRIPNKEVLKEFRCFTATHLSIKEDAMTSLFRFLQKKDMTMFLETYQEILDTNTSYYDLKEENSYHMFLLGMRIWMKDTYDITSNKEQGNGRYDILFRNRDSNAMSIIIELKYTNDDTVDLHKVTNEGMHQINKKRYTSGIDNILKVSLAHRGKEVVMSYE